MYNYVPHNLYKFVGKFLSHNLEIAQVPRLHGTYHLGIFVRLTFLRNSRLNA